MIPGHGMEDPTRKTPPTLESDHDADLYFWGSRATDVGAKRLASSL